MKKFNFTWGRIAAILFCGIALFVLIAYKTPIDEEHAKRIAKNAFSSLAKHMKMNPNEFEPSRVPTSDELSNYQYVLFIWKNKTKPGCTIEVDVDLYYVDARPTYKNCE